MPKRKFPAKVSELGMPTTRVFDPLHHGITQSWITAYMTCEQKFIYAIHKLVPEGAQKGAYIFGGLMHHLLAKIEGPKGVPANLKIDSAIEEYGDKVRRNGVMDEVQFETYAGFATALLPVYLERYKRVLKTRDYHMVEENAEAVGRHFKLRGMVDGVYTPQTTNWLLEHKTMGKIDEDAVLYSLMMDFQVQFYDLLVGESHKIDLSGCLFDVIRTPQLRRKVNETLGDFIKRVTADVKKREDFYFMQWEVKFGKRDRSRFQQKVDLIEKRMWATYRGDAPIVRNTSACRTPARVCPFLKNCASDCTDGLCQQKFSHPELEI